MPAHTLSDEDRFMNTVDITDDCWIWTGTVSNKGYGVFHPYGYKCMITAHRWLYCHVKGLDMDTKYTVRRKCRNKKCVNPAHMEL